MTESNVPNALLTPPREWIDLMRQYWADAAQCPASQIGDDTDIFSTRADSFDIVHLETRIEARFNIDLPEHSLIECPTPLEMATMVAEFPQAHAPAPRPAPDRSLQLLRAGGSHAHAPLAILPGGDALGLIDPAWLSRSIQSGLDVYGLHGQTDRRYPADDQWLTRIAADYRDELLEADPGSPWMVLGICLSAPIAWETARLLQASGRPVRLLLFDPVDPASLLGLSDVWRANALAGASLSPADLDLTIIWSPAQIDRQSDSRYSHLTTLPVPTMTASPAVTDHALRDGSMRHIAPLVRHWIEGAQSLYRRSPAHPSGQP